MAKSPESSFIGGEGMPLCMNSSAEEYRLVDLKNHDGILWLNYRRAQ